MDTDGLRMVGSKHRSSHREIAALLYSHDDRFEPASLLKNEPTTSKRAESRQILSRLKSCTISSGNTEIPMVLPCPRQDQEEATVRAGMITGA
jgi:hypothetical protein